MQTGVSSTLCRTQESGVGPSILWYQSPRLTAVGGRFLVSEDAEPVCLSQMPHRLPRRALDRNHLGLTLGLHDERGLGLNASKENYCAFTRFSRPPQRLGRSSILMNEPRWFAGDHRGVHDGTAVRCLEIACRSIR